MKFKNFLLTLIIFAALLTAFMLNQTSKAQNGPSLTTQILTDYTQTTSGVIGVARGLATENAAHIVWSEPVETDVPNASPLNWDMFYRKLPNGVTKNLSASFATKGRSYALYIQEGKNDEVCVVWQEEVTQNTYYLFFWNSALNKAVRSSVPIKENRTAVIKPFNCASTNQTVLAWHDGDDIFLWNTAANSQTLIASTMGKFETLLVQGVLHVVWTNGGYINIWNSNTQANQEVVNGNGYLLGAFADNKNIIHLIWNAATSLAECYLHWDSIKQTSDLITECDTGSNLTAVLDGEKSVHVFWINNSSKNIEHWNATNNQRNTVEITAPYIQNLKIIEGPDSRVHLFWHDGNTSELYYWNTGEKKELFVIAGSYDITYGLNWAFDSKGNVHVAWSEYTLVSGSGNLGYWTPSLSTPILVDENMHTPFITLDDQDLPHLLYSDYQYTGQPHYWNKNMVQPIVLTQSNIASIDGLVATNTNVYALFTTREPRNNYSTQRNYWSKQDDVVTISDHARTYHHLLDQSGNLYLYGIIDEAVPEERYPQSEDMLAARAQRSIEEYSIYLPILYK